MVMLFNFILPAFLALAAFGKAAAVELPPPADLVAHYGVQSQKVTVVEPHESTTERRKRVDYTALPLDSLLTAWFGDRWNAEDAEIVFFAKDGYRSVVDGPKLKKFRAFLAYARTDGAAFVVDNLGQHERNIRLGPYYLIWDNLSFPELQRQGAYGWPYQVIAIEWRSKTEDEALRPQTQSKRLAQGFEETKAYCLTCHNIRGIGGKKYPVDLLQAVCGWQDADLKGWIESPSRIKPGTTMPPLARQLPDEERRQISERIVGYLNAMKVQPSERCATK
ncbi:MAG: cytochrome c family protein [Gammaproteobacteria bacterium]